PLAQVTDLISDGDAQRAFKTVDDLLVVVAVRGRRFRPGRYDQFEHAGGTVGRAVAEVADLQLPDRNDVLFGFRHCSASCDKSQRYAGGVRPPLADPPLPMVKIIYQS